MKQVHPMRTQELENNRVKGFTLVELMTVLSVLVLLALFLVKGYRSELYNQKVISVFQQAQELVNAAALEKYEVTNPRSTDYDFSLASDNQATFTSIKDRVVDDTSIFDGIDWHGEIFSSRYEFERSENNLLQLSVGVPGEDWTFWGALTDNYDLSNPEGEGVVEEDATLITVYPRAVNKYPLDLTAMSRFIKKQYYWQNVR